MSICRKANELAWSGALENAEPSIRQRFEKNGEKFVMVDDKEVPIGLSGPEWIKKELVYTRGTNQERRTSLYSRGPRWPRHSSVSIYSSGTHYCGSPARAME